MRAIDLYAGIGGWSLGLKLAGVDVVGSYEWWQPAIDTHNGNHGTELTSINIRTMDLDSLPSDIDLVVGSPPCTQFSYSNRGGSGDLADGQVDLERFFAIVERLKPRFWAMENVPRVAKYLEACFSDSESSLYKYRELKPNIGVFDFSEFGCPQARKRCVATNIPLAQINQFKPYCANLTLGDVTKAIGCKGRVVDPVWGVELSQPQVTEREQEELLDDEELRLNRESKVFHPVYNNMSFPDRLDVPARTVTATCTRVSRESIVVASGAGYRRLTVRERATLQGFPITYQFFGKSFSEKVKMIGNAIPPTFSYILASYALGRTGADFIPHTEAGADLCLPVKNALATKVDTAGKTYPEKRRFRAAIPHLRFKSGMRFEFANEVGEVDTTWSMRFYSGNSKDIRTHYLDEKLGSQLEKCVELEDVAVRATASSNSMEELITSVDGALLQRIWTRRRQGEGPYHWVDLLGEIANDVYDDLLAVLTEVDAERIVLELVGQRDSNGKFVNEAKLKRHAYRIIAGVIVGVWFSRKNSDKQLARAA
ncbi:DNA (cytosine-5)-methyltransferase 1 [Loktanella sp. DSM 29012]|uniref:DNA cytosine methyltransferase n=1 Tax=Loktanella sp. DSM 29012 TaxID=1881056 RepID=UPI0008B02636|nr:DNA (cytosine-5-)-methyltransferase [Loktanella sp. DSM 29012]SEQ89137.1 DNA (cytosine-5)-methyltransferase 1 [Loktanella sp. DSM 29012]